MLGKLPQVISYTQLSGHNRRCSPAGGSYWLLDVIGSYQSNRKLDKSFQVWKLTVDTANDSAVVQGFNDTTLVVTQEIPYTDFPLEELKLYLIDGVILLPSEC